MSLIRRPFPEEQVPGELNLVLGAGGSRAVLGGTGAILALHLAGVRRWRTVGGVSGGSIPGAFLAAGIHPAELAHYVIEIDFTSLLTPRVSIAKLLWAYFLKECAWKRHKRDGALSSEKMGEFVGLHVKAWPESYWTVAQGEGHALLFTKAGVFAYKKDGTCQLVAETPPDIALAIRGSCAVPGIIDGVRYNGEFLLDGGLAPHGRCPVGLAREQLGALPQFIVACDVGEDAEAARFREPRLVRLARKLVCGSCCDPVAGPPVDAGGGVVLVNPSVNQVSSLEFNLSSRQKWQSLMSGFTGAIQPLAQGGILTGTKLEEALSIAGSFSNLEQRFHGAEDLAPWVEALLSDHGLY